MTAELVFPDNTEDFAAQAEKLKRRRALAESLVANAMKSNGGSGMAGQVYMVGNQYGNLAQSLGGSLMGAMADRDQADLSTRQRSAEAAALGSIPAEGPERGQAQLRTFQQMPSLREVIRSQMGLDKAEQDRIEKGEQLAQDRVEKEANAVAQREFLAAQGDLNRQNKVDLRAMPATVVHVGNGAGRPDADLDRQLKEERLRQMREGKPPAADKPLTEAQGNAYLFGTRADAAHKILDEVGTSYSPMKVSIAGAVEKVPGLNVGANAVLSDSEQRVFQAQRDFVNAILRKESGAAIAQSEFDNARKQYFPQPGDNARVIEQKRINRETAIKGLAKIVGPQGTGIGADLPRKPQQSGNERKTIGGKSYVKINGEWYAE